MDTPTYKPLLSYDEWCEKMEFVGKAGSHGVIRGLAELLHIWYEEEAKRAGWTTQDSCQVDFDDLPPANKKVMQRVARRVAELFFW